MALDNESQFTCTIDVVSWCAEPFSESELNIVIKKLNEKKAPGPDEVFYKYIIDSFQFLKSGWMILFNQCLDLTVTPTERKNSKISTIYKGKGDLKDPNNYRGNALLSCIFKILTKLLQNVINQIPGEQYGFLPQKCTVQPLIQLITELCKPKGKSTHASWTSRKLLIV